MKEQVVWRQNKELGSRERAADLSSLARATAYDRYIQALCIKPSHLRPDFILLAAFHGELARIPFLVREPLMGEIRLQWWRDVVNCVSGERSEAGNPLADGIVDFLEHHPTARTPFLAAIDARCHEVVVGPILNQDSFDSYLDGIGTVLFGVGQDLLGLNPTSPVSTALGSAGRAIALCDVVRRLPQHLALGRCPVPHSVLEDEVLHAGSSDDFDRRLKGAITTLARQARRHLADYRTVQETLPTAMALIVLPLALVEPYLRALEKESVTTWHTGSSKSPLARFLHLWWAGTKRRI